MNHMADHLALGMPYPMILVWAALAVLGAVLLAALIFFARRAPSDHLLITEIAASGHNPLRSYLDWSREERGTEADQARDTVFILPDIIHYTRFMTGNRFTFAHAQHIIFALINAMIESATKTVELSKLEGDAALFYVDAGRHSDRVIGETIIGLFQSFFSERKRLNASNLCPCKAYSHIDDLDLNVFVHRGRAVRFTFRGSVDHFGTDVIILHRMMKNGVNSTGT